MDALKLSTILRTDWLVDTKQWKKEGKKEKTWDEYSSKDGRNETRGDT